MKKHLMTFAALTLVGCGLLDSDGAQDSKPEDRIVYSDSLARNTRTQSVARGAAIFYVPVARNYVVDFNGASATIAHTYDSTFITLDSVEYAVPASACSIAITASASIPAGSVSFAAPITFTSPVSVYEPQIDTEASRPEFASSVNWGGLYVTGHYTIDCPDPRQ